MMIDKLTPEQEAELVVYRDRYIELGRSTSPLPQDKSGIDNAINEIYLNGGIPVPKRIIYLNSPKEILKHVKYYKLTDKDTPFEGWQDHYDTLYSQLSVDEKKKIDDYGKDFIDGFCYGSQDAGWVSYYDVVLNVLGVKEIEKYVLPWKYLVGKISWYLPLSEVCYISQNPVEINVNVNGQLHNTEGASVKYADGFCLYTVNGEPKASLMEVMFGNDK
jgi:hypothetical protein